MPDGTFVTAIEDLARRANLQKVEIEGVTYVTSQIADPRQPEPLAKPVVVHTLEALVEYLKSNRDRLDPAEHLVHVLGPTQVSVISALKGRFRQREQLVDALTVPPVVSGPTGDGRFRLNTFMPLAPFVIGLRSVFTADGDRDKVVSLVGNVREEAVRQVNDDGVTQEVTARQGRALRSNVEVPGSVRLAPYRTFIQVEQPCSEFVLRLRGGGEDSLPEVALFEADGGLWAVEAVATIRAYLMAALDGAWTVLA